MTDLDLADGSVAGLIAWWSLIHSPTTRSARCSRTSGGCCVPAGRCCSASTWATRRTLKTEGYGGHPMKVHVHRRSQPGGGLAARRGFTVEAQLLLDPDETCRGRSSSRTAGRSSGRPERPEPGSIPGNWTDPTPAGRFAHLSGNFSGPAVPPGQESSGMGKRTVHVSDFTGKVLPTADQVVRIVVLEHPDLVAGPVQLEAEPVEVESIDDAALDVAVVEIYDGHGGGQPRRIVLTASEFDALATDVPMAQLLRTAERVRPPKARKTDRPRLRHAGARRQATPGPGHRGGGGAGPRPARRDQQAARRRGRPPDRPGRPGARRPLRLPDAGLTGSNLSRVRPASRRLRPCPGPANEQSACRPGQSPAA